MSIKFAYHCSHSSVTACKMSRLAVVALCLLAATLAVALPSPKTVNPIQLIRRGPPPPPANRGQAKAHATKYFTQKLDHFDILNNATWQQVVMLSALWLCLLYLSSRMFLCHTEILYLHWTLHVGSSSYFFPGRWVGSERGRSWVHLCWWAGKETWRVHHRLRAQILWPEPPSRVSVFFKVHKLQILMAHGNTCYEWIISFLVK